MPATPAQPSVATTRGRIPLDVFRDLIRLGCVPSRQGLLSAARRLLDLGLLIYLVTTGVVLVTGGFDLGAFSATTAAKPLFVLSVLLPIRMAFSDRSWLPSARWIMSGGVRPAPAIADVMSAFLPVLVSSLLIGFVAASLIPAAADLAFEVPGPWPHLGRTLAVWDSGWYLDIALRGYYYHPDRPSSIAFFPLYPALMRVIASPFGGHPGAVFWSGVLISWSSLLGALVLLHLYTTRITSDRELARRSVFLMLVFPFSFYFLRVYTESLFLLLTVGAFYAAHQQRWWIAGAVGALATLTRPNGILIALPLMMLAWDGSVVQTLRRWGKLVPIPLALAGFCAFNYRLSGDPLAWLQAQQHWHYALDRLPYRHLLRTFSAIEQNGLSAELRRSANAPIEFLYTAVALLFLAAVPFVWRRFGAPSAVYVLVSLLIPLSGTTLEGIGRYASVLFPAFVIAATIRSRAAYDGVVIVSCILLALCTILFVGWHPLQ